MSVLCVTPNDGLLDSYNMSNDRFLPTCCLHRHGDRIQLIQKRNWFGGGNVLSVLKCCKDFGLSQPLSSDRLWQRQYILPKESEGDFLKVQFFSYVMLRCWVRNSYKFASLTALQWQPKISRTLSKRCTNPRNRNCRSTHFKKLKTRM